jgi:uncharacterized protein (PEP-CTERM system associated)
MHRTPKRPSRKRLPPPALVLLATAAAWPALAQEVVNVNRGTFVPTITAEGSYLETRGRPDAFNGREGVLRVSPGLRWSDRTGHLQGSLDYAGDLLVRKGRGADDTDFRNTLTARALAEVERGFAYVDGTAAITQQAVSPFGQQSVVGSTQVNNNQTEVRSVAVSPYLRGSAGGLADYEVRFGVGHSSTRGEAVIPTSRTSDALFRLASPRGGARVGWNLSATQRHVRTTGAAGADTADESRIRAGLTWAFSPQLQLSANAGAESVDEGARSLRHRDATGGVGLAWAPTPLTRLAVDVDHRYVGNTGRINFVTRGPYMVLSYTLARDTTFGIDGNAIGTPITLYQLLFLKYASVPDAADRDRLILAELAGRDPNQVSTVPLVGRAYSLQTRQDLSLAWTGRRLSLTVFAFASTSRGFGLATSSLVSTDEPVVQHGYTSTLAYRFTPDTTLSLSGTRRMTFGTELAAGTDLKSAELGLTSQIGRRTSARISARHTVFNSTTEPYRESALATSLTLRF